jgi:hypothetical protein
MINFSQANKGCGILPQAQNARTQDGEHFGVYPFCFDLSGNIACASSSCE